jgi:hypothetical protein
LGGLARLCKALVTPGMCRRTPAQFMVRGRRTCGGKKEHAAGRFRGSSLHGSERSLREVVMVAQTARRGRMADGRSHPEHMALQRAGRCTVAALRAVARSAALCCVRAGWPAPRLPTIAQWRQLRAQRRSWVDQAWGSGWDAASWGPASTSAYSCAWARPDLYSQQVTRLGMAAHKKDSPSRFYPPATTQDSTHIRRPRPQPLRLSPRATLRALSLPLPHPFGSRSG